MVRIDVYPPCLEASVVLKATFNVINHYKRKAGEAKAVNLFTMVTTTVVL